MKRGAVCHHVPVSVQATPITMTADDPQFDFLHYLTCDLPLGYPLKKPVASLFLATQQSSSRRELLHRQAEFLDLAKPFLETHPWIAYLAAVKHEAVLVTIPTYDEQLVDVVDKLFFRDLQARAKEFRAAARAAIEEPTATVCDRLVRLQSESAQIHDAIKKFKGAIQGGYQALEPLPPAPPEPDAWPGREYLSSIAAAILGSVVVGAVIPSSYGGMAWGILGWIVTGIVAWKVIGKARARAQVLRTNFNTYLRHENFRTLCRKSVDLILTLPVQARTSGLLDLAGCLAELEALPPERDVLESRYVRPFVAVE